MAKKNLDEDKKGACNHKRKTKRAGPKVKSEKKQRHAHQKRPKPQCRPGDAAKKGSKTNVGKRKPGEAPKMTWWATEANNKKKKKRS